MLFAILYLPVDPWVRAFLGLGTLYLTTSAFTLAKCIRDAQDVAVGRDPPRPGPRRQDPRRARPVPDGLLSPSGYVVDSGQHPSPPRKDPPWPARTRSARSRTSPTVAVGDRGRHGHRDGQGPGRHRPEGGRHGGRPGGRRGRCREPPRSPRPHEGGAGRPGAERRRRRQDRGRPGQARKAPANEAGRQEGAAKKAPAKKAAAKKTAAKKTAKKAPPRRPLPRRPPRRPRQEGRRRQEGPGQEAAARRRGTVDAGRHHWRGPGHQPGHDRDRPPAGRHRAAGPSLTKQVKSEAETAARASDVEKG